MSLADEIAALPQWPKQPDISDPETAVDNAIAFAAAVLDCYATRLALTRAWINARPHDGWCERYPSNTDEFLKCGCGRDALLAALEPPK